MSILGLILTVVSITLMSYYLLKRNQRNLNNRYAVTAVLLFVVSNLFSKLGYINEIEYKTVGYQVVSSLKPAENVLHLVDTVIGCGFWGFVLTGWLIIQIKERWQKNREE